MKWTEGLAGSLERGAYFVGHGGRGRFYFKSRINCRRMGCIQRDGWEREFVRCYKAGNWRGVIRHYVFCSFDTIIVDVQSSFEVIVFYVIVLLLML